MTRSTSKCVYRITDSAGTLLYVGCSFSPMSRVQEHCKMKSWARDISNVSVEWFDTPQEADAAEVVAIQNEDPVWNVHHKSGKKRRSRGVYVPEFDAHDRETWDTPQ